jgi:nucleotide-binding universal stress UspA family protein
MDPIVVAYDGTEPAERALARAVELAAALHAKLVVGTVEPNYPTADIAVYMGDGGFGLPLIAPMEADMEHAERWKQHLAETRRFVESHGVEVEMVSPTGRPAEEIVEIAAQHNAQLIVVGTHESSMLRRLFRGSVSAGVVQKAHCDVLVVHPHT